jgi:hypothetical protein
VVDHQYGDRNGGGADENGDSNPILRIVTVLLIRDLHYRVGLGLWPRYRSVNMINQRLSLESIFVAHASTT